MNQEIKAIFHVIKQIALNTQSQVENFAMAVAAAFVPTVCKFELEAIAIEVTSIQTEVEPIPKAITIAYGKPFNDYFDRVAHFEKHLGITNVTL